MRQKVAPKSVSIEQFKRFEKAVNKLVLSNKKLQAEKNVLEKKLNELDTGTILEKSQKFYSDSFADLVVIVAIVIAIGAGLIPLLQQIKIRMDTKKVEALEIRSDNLDDKLSKLEELEKKIDTAVDDNNKLKNRLDKISETTNTNFAVNFVQAGKMARTPFSTCVNYITAVKVIQNNNNAKTFIEQNDILQLTLNEIRHLNNEDIKNIIINLIFESTKAIVKDFYSKCLDALIATKSNIK